MTSQAKQRPAPFKPNYWARLGYVLIVVYCIWAIQSLEISFDRVIAGLDNAQRFLAAMVPPSFVRWKLMVSNLLETLQITIIASAFGVLISLPIGLTAARNLMPTWLTWFSRAIIAICRSFHPVIFAILFVKAVGFGPLAGILTLIFASIGFIGKLFAEAIEEISLKPVEAMKAVGAPFMSVLIFAVLPQVLNRFIGFATYQTDANLRNSTMIGIVGAGGIGGTLSAAFQRYDYDFVSAILIAIIALVMVSEFLAQRVKRVFR
ncbi:MAG: phosphonate ABC transporter, permease protein PhnE [Pseudomonadota bacterium]